MWLKKVVLSFSLHNLLILRVHNTMCTFKTLNRRGLNNNNAKILQQNHQTNNEKYLINKK